jgi:hypothetical protein
MRPKLEDNDLDYGDEDEAVADALLVLSEMARERGVATIAELGDLPPLDPFTKAKYLAMAKQRLEKEAADDAS